MSEQRFVVKLNQVHRARGLTVYRVAKSTGINKNTVLKYLGGEEIITDQLSHHVLALSKFFDVDWRDPAIVDVIEVDEVSDES